MADGLTHQPDDRLITPDREMHEEPDAEEEAVDSGAGDDDSEADGTWAQPHAAVVFSSPGGGGVACDAALPRFRRPAWSCADAGLGLRLKDRVLGLDLECSLRWRRRMTREHVQANPLSPTISMSSRRRHSHISRAMWQRHGTAGAVPACGMCGAILHVAHCSRGRDGRGVVLERAAEGFFGVQSGKGEVQGRLG